MSKIGKKILDHVRQGIPATTQRGIVISALGNRVQVRMSGRTSWIDNLSGSQLMPGDTVELTRSHNTWSITGVKKRAISSSISQRSKMASLPSQAEDAALFVETINAAAVGTTVVASDTLPFTVGQSMSRALVFGILRLNPTTIPGNIQFDYYFVVDESRYIGPKMSMRYVPQAANDYGIFPMFSIFSGLEAGDHTAEIWVDVIAVGGSAVALANTYCMSAVEIL